MNIDELQTGYILLISDYQTGLFNLFLSMIRYGTHSDYVHVAIVLKNPTFIDEMKISPIFQFRRDVFVFHSTHLNSSHIVHQVTDLLTPYYELFHHVSLLQLY